MEGSLSSGRSHNLIENTEYSFTSKDLAFISDIMRNDTGIILSEAKASLVYSRLAKRIRKLGLPGFSEYCALVKSPEGEAERKEMMAALTTNVTSFFREPHHFEHMKHKILPDLARRAKAGERIRMWSAACSSGPEPYSMALTLLQILPEAYKYDIRILATDIDENILSTARAGIYEESLLSPVPADLRRSWFNQLDDRHERFQVKDELRSLISFKSLNLIGTWPMKGIFQVIFCRNVVIYFDNHTQEELWSRFVPLLEEDGALYVGHSERIAGPAAGYVRNDGVTTYRKLNGGARK